MRALVSLFAVCLLAGFSGAGWSQTTDEALKLLGKIANAGQRLNYSGVFVYQSGAGFETSRITHVVDASGERERLEVLDGSPREVVRRNREVRCVLPDIKTVIIDRSGRQRSFPSRLGDSHRLLAEHYEVVLAGNERVAGMDTQRLFLVPKDNLRYRHEFWVEVATGLLLKSRMLDESGSVVEQFAFTDVVIGDAVDQSLLRPRIETDGWRIIDADGHSVPHAESGWTLSQEMPGFELRSVSSRPLGKNNQPILHLMFSDGLSAMSVFIEPGELVLDGGLGPIASGPINIYRRLVGDQLITVLGEVPVVALQRLGDALQPTH